MMHLNEQGYCCITHPKDILPHADLLRMCVDNVYEKIADGVHAGVLTIGHRDHELVGLIRGKRIGQNGQG